MSGQRDPVGTEVIAVAIDPVCGMEVDEDDLAALHEYQGDTYYFCAPGCKNRFEKNPEEYLPVGDDGGNGPSEDRH